MADATGEAKEPPLRVTFDRRLKLEFHGARITSDGGLLAYRELDDVFDLTAMAASTLGEGRRGKNIRHRLLGLLRQAVYGRLAGYEDVNDAERLARDPVMRGSNRLLTYHDQSINLSVLDSSNGGVVLNITSTVGGQIIDYGTTKGTIEDFCSALRSTQPSVACVFT